ncbi:choice-of-anchor J domain-containing protein [Acidovorax sp. MR-S7]|uniref:choice-of-anchor J domain-containing protein n=1 Tax=Acidovorax sp. MR-S7 TaxID=1268622 RepID=UPI000372E27C|nr:choice-of-anchor J domain-containing protein [Acidovorax sp. MR-S7]GAD20542.1 hypothetical protein AVS7_00303 [Acidovorax sp. MR-S7]
MPCPPLSPLRALAAFALLAALAVPARADTVVFSEDFGTQDWGTPDAQSCNPDFPAGWTRHDVDARPPAAQTAWVNDAWVVSSVWAAAEGNCVAYSTSYYDPAGAADDWLVTPAIAIPAVNPRLRFRAQVSDAAYADGYEVRWGTANSVPALSANPALLTVAAENATWTMREIDLSALAGQTVHLAFRNTSVDKFLLMLDEVQVVSVLVHDAAITAALRPHAELLRVPVGQAPALQLGATVRNGGASALTNAVVTAQVLLDGSPVHSVQAAAIPSLAPGATADVTMPAYTVVTPGAVTVQYTVATAEADDDASNNAMASASLEVTDWELGRDDGAAVLALGIGGDGGQVGTHYTLAQPAWAHAVRYYARATNAELAGAAITGEIRAMSAGQPGALLAQTLPFTVPTPPAAGFVDLPLAAPLLLPAGDYYFGLVEPASAPGLNRTLDLGLSATLYQAGRNWARFTPGAPDWSLVEALNPVFARAAMLRVVFGPADTTPPAFTASPTVTPPAAGGTTATASVAVNEPATGYWQVLPAADPAPLAADLLANGAPVSLTGTAAATLSLTGLVPGTAYRLHFIARDVAGNAQATVASVVFVVPLDTSGLPLTGGGTAQVAVSDDGGNTCYFSTAQFTANGIADPLPTGVALAGDLFDFVLDGCAAGATATISITYPSLPAGAQYYKHGPRSGQPPGWYPHPATVNGSTVTFSITNGGAGDDDLDAANSQIVDAGGPVVVAAAAGAAAIPTLTQWGVLLLSALSALLGLAALQRRRI